MNTVSILSYGIGNIKSVERAFHAIGTQPKLISTASEIYSADRLVLPGVGAFSACSNALRSQNLWHSILDFFKLERPFLGICVGMQMLATKGFENGEFAGLDWISGEVKKINNQNNNLKIPHMGWNTLKFLKETAFTKRLLKKMKVTNLNDVSAYFVHSYNFKNKNANEKVITSCYGEEITAMISKENIIGTQFHPEKSHYFGLAFLKTFLEQE